MFFYAILFQGQHKCYIPNKSTLEALAAASCGDIRSAINSLQFACLKGMYGISNRNNSLMLVLQQVSHFLI